jgi:hypothetical protein
MADEVTIEILDDGTIKSTTNPVSPANHQSAESFMKDLAQLTGGEATRTRRGHRHAHTHTHVEQKT